MLCTQRNPKLTHPIYIYICARDSYLYSYQNKIQKNDKTNAKKQIPKPTQKYKQTSRQVHLENHQDRQRKKKE
jgi:hypothetical protein